MKDILEKYLECSLFLCILYFKYINWSYLKAHSKYLNSNSGYLMLYLHQAMSGLRAKCKTMVTLQSSVLLIATFVSANRPLGSPQVMVTQATGPYDTYDMHAKNEVRRPIRWLLSFPCVGQCLFPLGDWWLCVVSLGLIGQLRIAWTSPKWFCFFWGHFRLKNRAGDPPECCPVRTGITSVASIACNPLKLVSCVGLSDWLFQN